MSAVRCGRGLFAQPGAAGMALREGTLKDLLSIHCKAPRRVGETAGFQRQTFLSIQG